MQEVDLLDVIDQSVAAFSREFRDKELNLMVNLAESLPCIQADPDALQQVLRYFLANASQVSSPGGTVTLEILVQQKDDRLPSVELQVKDSGGGIPAEDLPSFFASLHASQDVQIRGFGSASRELPKVQALVEAHTGRLWIDTQAGKATTFHVLLPVFQTAPENPTV